MLNLFISVKQIPYTEIQIENLCKYAVNTDRLIDCDLSYIVFGQILLHIIHFESPNQQMGHSMYYLWLNTVQSCHNTVIGVHNGDCVIHEASYSKVQYCLNLTLFWFLIMQIMSVTKLTPVFWSFVLRVVE